MPQGQQNLLDRFGACFADNCHPALIEFSVWDLVVQRVIGMAQGYEGLNE